MSDTALMRLAQADRTEAFNCLVERYHRPLLRVAQSRVHRRDLAEEIVQEALLSAYRGRRTFDPRFSFRTWLWTILLNQCKAQAARQLRRPSTESLDETDSSIGLPSANVPTPFAALWQKHRAEILDDLLDRLPQPQADALRLRFFAELKFQEIADTMKCSLLTAKNRVRAGLLKLAELAPTELAEHGGDRTNEAAGPAGAGDIAFKSSGLPKSTAAHRTLGAEQ